MAATFILKESARVRFVTGAMMYFAQGIPAGLLSIAIPAWLATKDVSAADIGTYLAVVILPWVFKLVTGPIMDRFGIPSMGRRRPWVLGAQLGLSISLLALMVIDDPVAQISQLMMIGVLINIFAATQDVAVDGMSIDLTPVNEQGRLNAFMSFGKSIGWASTAAVTGLLLANFGMQVTAVVVALASSVIFFAFISVQERQGEKKLPWSEGKATETDQIITSFKSVFQGVNGVLWKRTSLFIMLIMVIDGFISGYGSALMPIAAVKVFGFTTPEWTQIVAVMGIVGAGVTLAMGPMIDRFGPKKMMIMTTILVGIHALLLAQTQYLWNDSLYVKVMLSIWVMMQPVTMVSMIALGMTVCSSKCSATQFAIYMSVANLGASGGSKVYGMLSEHSNYVQSYMFMGIMLIGLVVVLLLFRHNHSNEADPNDSSHKKRVRRYTLGANSGQAGVFWSGAMRCPKCRADMEQIDIQGTEVDRCNHCYGIWFDAGEMEEVLSNQAAASLDTGDHKQGKEYNHIDDYNCSRCGGSMMKRYDEKQQHIWYETCADCNGSFFDAGEFLDLSKLTVSDFFKGLTISGRK